MLYLARSSPKLCWLSRAPSALALTWSPGADFFWAREIKLASPLGSGLKPKELSRETAITNKQSVIAAAMILYRRERLMLSLCIRVKVFASMARARGRQWLSTLCPPGFDVAPDIWGLGGLGERPGPVAHEEDWHSGDRG